jgi:hypothetical protein
LPSKRKEKIKMYKEIIICILVVIFIFSMDLISNNYTKNVFFNINDELSNLRNEITSEDKNEEKIKEKMKEIEEKWHKNINLLSCYLEHNELEKVQRQITLIKGNIDVKEYNQATPQLDECKFIINHIIDKESFLIRNIF